MATKILLTLMLILLFCGLSSTYAGASGITERVSVDSSGNQSDGDSGVGDLSADGRFVVFASFATNLVSGDTNGVGDIFLRDRQMGVTTRISVAPNGTE